MIEPIFNTQGDYHVPLPMLLAELPNGQGYSAEVQELFWKRYRSRIPAEHRKEYGRRGDIWAKKVQWCRFDLTQLGLLDSPGYGIWRITQRGREWLARNPQATRIPNYQGTNRTSRQARPAGTVTPPRTGTPVVPVGVTLEMLEETRKSMSPEVFQQVWGTMYEQLVTKERSKWITQVSDRVLLESVRQPLNQIQDYLRGRRDINPAPEDVCDWIHFCHILGLCREAWALLQFVKADEVSPRSYERARTISLAAKETLDRQNLT